jgi:2-polyprenyl-6-methoxyphenol hydroxylase-like FAD-dependent oxidoreductase
VGGSLTGLMTGIVLKSKGYKVRVLERSASQALESTAAGIRAGPEVYGFIEQYVRNVPDYAIPVRTVEVMDNLGAFIQNVPLQDILQLSTWKILHDLLKGALLDDEDGNPVATYHTRQLVQSVEKAGENFQLDVLDLEKDTSTTFESDLVIAADGAHSAIRNKLCPGTSPQYAGYVTWRGRIPEEAMSAEAREALQNRCVILRVDGGYQVS